MIMRPLTEFCTINMGQSPDSKTYNDNGKGLPFYQGNADFGEIHPETRIWCSAPVKMAEAGDILISVRAPIGAMNMAVERCCIGRGLAALTPIREKCGKQFLFYALQSKVDLLNAQGTGSTFKAISKKVLEATLIPAYSIQEQEQITATISHVDRAIAARRNQLVLLEQLVKSRFVELFGDPVDNPKNHLVKSLQELIDVGYITYHLDGNHGGDYPRSEEFVDSGVPYIGANSIVNGEIDFSMAKFLTVERAGKLRKGIAQNDDVLFAHNATVGPTVVLKTTEPKVILSTSLTAYRCNQSKLLPNYLKAYMQSDGFVRQYSGEMKQTTRNQVPITAQKKYLFLVPPIEEQKQFAAFVEQTDKLKVAIRQSLKELEMIKKAMMQEYFRRGK